MKLFKTTLTVILMCIISLTCASVNRDEDTFRIFIDFLKQEFFTTKMLFIIPFPLRISPSTMKCLGLKPIVNASSNSFATESATTNAVPVSSTALLLEMPHRKNERKTKKELRDSEISLEKSI